MSAALAVPPGASAASLADLIGGVIPYVDSSDGTVRFDSFQYIPTVGAPNAADVNIVPDASVPQGFLVQGTFSVTGIPGFGVGLNALLGYKATVLSGGPFSKAQLYLDPVDVTVAGSAGSLGSSAFIAEKVDSLTSTSVTTLTVAQSAAEPPVPSDVEALAGYGHSLGVLTNIGLTAMPETTSHAEVREFAVNFVPEPATGVLLLGLCGVAALRRR